MDDCFFKYQMALFHMLFRMGQRGVNINKEALEEVRKEVAGKYAMTKERWNLLTRKDESDAASEEAKNQYPKIIR